MLTASRFIDKRQVVHFHAGHNCLIAFAFRRHAINKFYHRIVAHRKLTLSALIVGNSAGIHKGHWHANKLAIAYHFATCATNSNIAPCVCGHLGGRVVIGDWPMGVAVHCIGCEYGAFWPVHAHDWHIWLAQFAAQVFLDSSAGHAHIGYQIAVSGAPWRAGCCAVKELHHLVLQVPAYHRRPRSHPSQTQGRGLHRIRSACWLPLRP